MYRYVITIYTFVIKMVFVLVDDVHLLTTVICINVAFMIVMLMVVMSSVKRFVNIISMFKLIQLLKTGNRNLLIKLCKFIKLAFNHRNLLISS